MISNSKTQRPPSLAQCFDAPEDYIGHFGWLCGYSAEALFLDDAAERFTRLTRSQRAHQGRISLAVLLDPGNPAISFQDAPGVAHLPIIDHENKPFKLLHAKVALLGYRHQKNHSQWQLRLLVSTGNWTRQTLEESLDLVWRIDIASESISHPVTDTQKDCADIKSAWSLLGSLQELFDTRLLNASIHGRPSETMNAKTKVGEWVTACSGIAKGKPRFFDNRSKSLLSQLPEKVNACGKVKRNYLAMGSGFYEASNDHNIAPKVPVNILNTLRKEGLLVSKPEVDLYVNPNSCQSIASSLKALSESGITVRTAATPTIVFGSRAQRSLHAKFLFSANCRDSSNACTNAWVYLGSGNLTHPGFANKMSDINGNLEAGVVFAPNSLYWMENKTNQGHQVVTNLLPIQWEDIIVEADSLFEGSDMEQRDDIFIAPPVAWLKWHEADGVRELRVEEPSRSEFEVLDSAGIACLKTQIGIRWHEVQPRQVSIRWKANEQQFESYIPVVDQYGRIAATQLSAIDIDEALWQLADFPMPPDDDIEDIDGGGGEENESSYNVKGQFAPMTTYPIRQMMELVESIAAKQTEINEIDWPLWCNRLEQTLGQASDSAPVKYFREKLKLNPLSPLKHKPFKPSFAENSDSVLGKLYEETLSRIEKNWKVNELSKIEGQNESIL